jgi:accessory gene regulator protein AgrB
MRLGAGVANIFEPNDEGRISLYFGLNLYTIVFIVVGFLFFLVYKTSKRDNYKVKTNIFTFIMSLLFIILISYIDAKFKIKFV